MYRLMDMVQFFKSAFNWRTHLILDQINNLILYPNLTEQSDYEQIVTILKENPSLDLNCSTYPAPLPLYEACRQANLPVIELLMQWGADINFYSNISPGIKVPIFEEIILYYLSKSEHDRQIISKLLESGVVLHSELLRQVALKNPRVLPMCLMHVKDISQIKGGPILVALSSGSWSYHLEEQELLHIVSSLIHSGISLYTEEYGALHYAAYHSYLELIKLMLDCKSCLNPLEINNTIPVVIQRALDSLDEQDGVYQFVFKLEKMEKRQITFDVNGDGCLFLDEKGTLIEQKLLKKSDIALANQLLDRHGAMYFKPEKLYRLALLYLLERKGYIHLTDLGDTRLVRLLLQHGANATEGLLYLLSIHFASEDVKKYTRRIENIFVLLIQYGADVNQLHAISKSTHPKLIELMIEAGANRNQLSLDTKIALTQIINPEIQDALRMMPSLNRLTRMHFFKNPKQLLEVWDKIPNDIQNDFNGMDCLC